MSQSPHPQPNEGTQRLVNGKYYPMWQSLVDGKKFIGGTLTQFDMGMRDEDVIEDIALEPNGEDSAKVVFYLENDDDPVWFDVSLGGISGNPTGEDGLCISVTYMGQWILKEPTNAK